MILKPKGTKDIFNEKIILKNQIINEIIKIVKKYNFQEIQTPTFEKTNVFSKNIGKMTDIVLKEMFTFQDKKDRNMVLRPEGTAGVIRAIIENKLLFGKKFLKLFYQGSMFRYENPQKGRQREFTQFGVELISPKNFLFDCEIIALANSILKHFNIKTKLEINSLSSLETRQKYSEKLKIYFQKYFDQLEPISKQRIHQNPLRILDDKIESKKHFVKNAPRISEFYDDESKKYFENVLNFLDQQNIKYEINYNLIRGLDYYTETTFEFKSISNNNSQDTIIGGGRYQDFYFDNQKSHVSGIGFAIGIERLIDEYLKHHHFDYKNDLDIYIINNDDKVKIKVLNLVENLRNHGFKVEWNFNLNKFQKALIKSDQYNPKFKIIIFAKEFIKNIVIIKFNNQSYEVKINDIIDFIKSKKGVKNNERI